MFSTLTMQCRLLTPHVCPRTVAIAAGKPHQGPAFRGLRFLGVGGLARVPFFGKGVHRGIQTAPPPTATPAPATTAVGIAANSNTSNCPDAAPAIGPANDAGGVAGRLRCLCALGPEAFAQALAGRNPPLATDNLLENTDGILRPHQCSLGAAACLLPSIYADARYIDAVNCFKGPPCS